METKETELFIGKEAKIDSLAFVTLMVAIEQEIESGSWFIFESKLEYVFNLKDNLWNEILDTEYLEILKESIKNIPLDPSLN